MKKFLYEHGIEFFSMIPLSKCKIIKPYLLEKNGFDENANTVVMLFPYRSEKRPVNLSVYASVKDYHKYVEILSHELEEYIKSRYPSALFKVFADHSPIDEVHAACVSGLGFIGDNGLLINEKYSSFVFLGECITNLSPEELGLEYAQDTKVRECLHCKRCALACPSHCIASDDARPKSECLSAITQKKGTLTEEEEKLILANGSIWGCDICQNVCPFTKNASFTPIEFFKEDVITLLDTKTLGTMSEEEFYERPFSWRGRAVIERNAKLYEKHKADKTV